MQYVLSGGQLQFNPIAFTCEMMLPGSPLKKLLGTEIEDTQKRPKLSKFDNVCVIDFNGSDGIVLDEGFYDLFRMLKMKYKEKLTGRVVIRISAITSYHVVLNLNNDDGKVVYE